MFAIVYKHRPDVFFEIKHFYPPPSNDFYHPQIGSIFLSVGAAEAYLELLKNNEACVKDGINYCEVAQITLKVKRLKRS